MNPYNQEYFEEGIRAGVSCYENYRWMPEMSILMASSIIKHLELKEGGTVLGFGCSKGF